MLHSHSAINQGGRRDNYLQLSYQRNVALAHSWNLCQNELEWDGGHAAYLGKGSGFDCRSSKQTDIHSFWPICICTGKLNAKEHLGQLQVHICTEYVLGFLDKLNAFARVVRLQPAYPCKGASRKYLLTLASSPLAVNHGERLKMAA